MQFEPTRKRVKIAYEDENTNPYPYWINFYTTPPVYKVSLQDIEDVASERLRILQVLESLVNVEASKRTKQFYEVTLSQINGVKLSNNENNFFHVGRSTKQTSQVFEARKRDHISHFLLRIYYCQTPELRKWFVNREVELFRLRLMDSSLTNSSILQECLAYYGYNYEIVSIDQRADMHNHINWMEPNKSNLSSLAFKFNFEDVLELVRNRKVYLNNGYAYITAVEMLSVLCNEFRENLSRELARMHTIFDQLDEPRLVARLESLHQKYIGNTSKKPSDEENHNKNRLSIEQIEPYSKELFPPCMRSIHETLRRDHHLKHYGRLHYGLFLKSAGLSLENAIDFFRSEMSVHNPEKFQKEYSYTIRYIYGKEGKRVQLSAYSCQKIITGSAPGPTDTHGCPFKHFDINNLKTLLIRYGVNDETSLDEIIRMVTEDKNATGACSKYFSVKYGSPIRQETVYHPNQFYTEAHRITYEPQLPTQQPTPESSNQEDDMPIEAADVTADTTINSLDDSVMDDSVGFNDYDDILLSS